MQRTLKRNMTVQSSALPGYPAWLSELLAARGIDTPEKARAFLMPETKGMNDPLLLHDMDKALSLIRQAKENGVRAVVYGDYDVDGICASAIMHQILCTFGLDAAVYIPDRHEEGYGLNAGAVRAISEKAGLLITVDCGVTGIEETRLAKQLGMTVIITDHHTLPPELPEADAVIDPLLPPYPFPSLCGAGVAYQLGRALLGDEAAKDCLDLAALATVADMVPLLDENRLIVKAGLPALDHTARAGIRALIKVAGLPENLRSDHIAFGLAPRLNACGRLQSALTALRLIQTGDKEEADSLALMLERLNQERRTLEKQVLDDAVSQLSQTDLSEDRIIVICGEGYESGVVGLAAGRLAEKTGYPAVILSRQGELAVGSARSAGDVDIYAALFECRDLFLRFGGHRQAAGMTLKFEDVPAFRRRVNEAVRRQLNGRALMPTYYYDALLSLSDVNADTIRNLRLMEPYGMGNPEPVFLLRGAGIVTARAVGSGGAHLKLTISDGPECRDAVAFRRGDLAARMPRKADILFTPVENVFRGNVSWECRISALIGWPETIPVKMGQIIDALWQDFSSAAENNVSSGAEAWSPARADEWARMPQGTLIFCRTRETALKWRERFPQIDLLCAPPDDTRAYTAAVYGAAAKAVTAPYRRVILADGDLTGRDGALLPPLEGRIVMAAPRSEALKALMRTLVPTADDMRRVYRAVRAAGSVSQAEKLSELSGVPLPALLSSLWVMRDMELIAFDPEPFGVSLLPFKKADPAQNLLYQRLAGWEGG